MTQDASISAGRLGEWKVVGPVCVAHFLSHYYMLLLAPLFAFVRADYGVSYTTLALALTAFNVVSALLQTPAGFLVDRIGARIVLIAGVALGAVAFAVAGLVDSFTVLIAMFALAGLGNTAYHPADYSLLTHHTAPDRVGQIFSFHTFAGILGSAVAPATLLALQSQFGWRGAFAGAALFGLIVLLLLLPNSSRYAAMPRHAAVSNTHAAGQATADRGWRVLLSAPILLSFAFFVLISIQGGLNSFMVVALGGLYGTSDTLANVALTALLAMNALGVLAGGILASRTESHATVAGSGLLLSGVVTALIAVVGWWPPALVFAAGLSGFFVGIATPSRDMLVRAATPHGASGRVFGFVSSGFNVGAMIAPTIYGMLMDHGAPRAVFLFSAACSIASIITVTVGFAGRRSSR
jgi:MFS family permease